MKKNSVFFNKLFFIFGMICVLYSLFVEFTLGEVNFLDLIFAFGILSMIYSTIEYFFRISLISILPSFFRRIIKIFIIINILAFLLIESSIVSTINYSTFYKNDYTIVLGSGLLYDELTTTMIQRLDKALEIFTLNPSTIFIVSGGIGSYSTLAESTAMKEYLLQHGVPEYQIIEEPYSANTVENLTFSNQDESTAYQYQIVSSDFHLYRIEEICKALSMSCNTVGSKTRPILLPNFMVREYFAIIKYYFVETFF